VVSCLRHSSLSKPVSSSTSEVPRGGFELPGDNGDSRRSHGRVALGGEGRPANRHLLTMASETLRLSDTCSPSGGLEAGFAWRL